MEHDIGKSAYKIKLIVENFRKARDELLYPSTYPVVSILSLLINIDKSLLDRKESYE